jgi:hypothetical protein
VTLAAQVIATGRPRIEKAPPLPIRAGVVSLVVRTGISGPKELPDLAAPGQLTCLPVSCRQKSVVLGATWTYDPWDPFAILAATRLVSFSSYIQTRSCLRTGVIFPRFRQRVRVPIA